MVLKSLPNYKKNKKTIYKIKPWNNWKLKNEFPCCEYARSDTTGKIIKNCRGDKQFNNCINRLDTEKQIENFRILLGFKENEIFERKEYSIIRVKSYFIDLVFPEHKLRIEIDENGHIDRSEIKEQQREGIIKEAGITLIRINPDKKTLILMIKLVKFKILLINLILN